MGLLAPMGLLAWDISWTYLQGSQPRPFFLCLLLLGASRRRRLAARVCRRSAGDPPRARKAVWRPRHARRAGGSAAHAAGGAVGRGRRRPRAAAGTSSAGEAGMEEGYSRQGRTCSGGRPRHIACMQHHLCLRMHHCQLPPPPHPPPRLLGPVSTHSTCCPPACRSCTAALQPRSGPASESCKSRCRVRQPRACLPKELCTLCAPQPWSCCAARWPTARRCPCCLALKAKVSLRPARLLKLHRGALLARPAGARARARARACTLPRLIGAASSTLAAAAGGGVCPAGLAEEARLLEAMATAVGQILDVLVTGGWAGRCHIS